jgi:signal transduction histidine kinase
MQRLLNDLLELSRVGRLTNKPEVIRFNDLVAEVLELVHGRISQGGIRVQVAENLPAVFGDRQRIQEVVQNLIDNAAKFMGDQPSPQIEIGQEDEIGGKPVFFVKDNGIGISPEYQDRIFGLFEKLNVQSEGTGIGLALVKRIVESQGGRIWVESELGKGAAFYFSLLRPPAS